MFQVVQRDVESHGKIVLSVVKLCEKHSQNNSSPVDDALNGVKRESPLRKAQRWERRWHLLYLKCLEWQYYIEEQIKNLSIEVVYINIARSLVYKRYGILNCDELNSNDNEKNAEKTSGDPAFY